MFLKIFSVEVREKRTRISSEGGTMGEKRPGHKKIRGDEKTLAAPMILA